MLKLKVLSATFASAIALSALGGAMAAKPNDDDNPKKQYVCHHTAGGGQTHDKVVIINVGGSGSGPGSTKAVRAHTDDPTHNQPFNPVDGAGNTLADVQGCGAGPN